MKNLALGALFIGLVACKGGDAPILIDSPDDGGTAACNPVAQTGCAPNEKCTWLIDQVTPAEVGHIGCAPVDGNEVVDGASCLDAGDEGGPAPGPTGFDNCIKGSICIARTCQKICDPQEVGAASGCDAQHECGSYSGLFESGGSTVAGACDALCNIMDQTLVIGGESCGSTDPKEPNRGCFLNAFFKTGSCAPIRLDNSPNNVAGQPLHNNRTDGVEPLTNAAGDAFKNGCAPGYTAMYPENDTSMKFVCTGICAPVALNVANPTNVNGDPTVAAKLPRQLTSRIGDATCAPTAKGRATNLNGGVQNCVFSYGLFLLADGTIDPMLGAEGETVGFCFPHAVFTYETAGNPAVPFPNFATLPAPGATTGTFPECTGGCDTADFIVSGFRVTTATRAQAMLFQTSPRIPMKRAFRLGVEDKLPALRR